MHCYVSLVLGWVTVCGRVNHLGILEELRQLTGKVERDEVKQDQVNDWRFAAMVVDRLCLVAFTTFTVVSTFTILLSAPSLHAR